MNQEIFSLKRDATELDPILLNGRVLLHGESWIAIPREIVPSILGVESIVFELIRSADLLKPSQAKIWLRAARLERLIMVLIPCLIVLSYGVGKGWESSWMTAFFSLMGVIFLQVSVNALSDAEDYLRLIDLPGRLGGSGVIQKGWANARQLKNLGYFSLFAGALCGVPVVLKYPPVLILIGLLAAMGVLSYSSKPIGIKYRILGDISIFILLGPLLTLGYSLSVFGRLDLSAVFIGSFCGLISCSVSHLNNLQDIEFDRASGISTLASKLGFKASRYFLVGLYAAAFMILLGGLVWKYFPFYPGVFTFALLPSLIKLVTKVFKASGPASALLNGIRLDAMRLYWKLGGLLLVGVLFSYLAG